jgi:hypothetical protein
MRTGQITILRGPTNLTRRDSYLMRGVYQVQQRADPEILNISRSGFFRIKAEDCTGLLHYVSTKDRAVFEEALECGNATAKRSLSIL